MCDVVLKNLTQSALQFFNAQNFVRLNFLISGIMKDSFVPIVGIAVSSCLTDISCSNGLGAAGRKYGMVFLNTSCLLLEY